MSFADDAEQWRSAIDPKSGKTYWYHRVNRISTWIRPPFMPDLLTSPAPSSYSSSSPLLTPVIFENRGPLVEKISDHKYSSDLITKSTTENKSSDVHAESQKELQRTSPHHLSTRIQNAVSCLTRSEEHLRVDALLLLTSRCGIAAEISAELSKMPSLLSNLVGIISRGESKICRRLALSILCSFAICKNSSSIFQDNQSWVIISRKFLYWDGDKESTLLFCNLICCLLDRPARCVIPNETVESIGDLLGYMLDDYRTYSKSGQIDLLSLRILSSGSSSSFLPGDWNFLYCLYIGAEKGHHTSSLLLLVILSSAIGSIPNNSMKEEREESYMNDSALVLNVLQFGGGASILKSLSSAGNVDESVRRRARDLLLEGMAKSAYLRESVMDGFLNLSFGYSFQQNIDRKADENDFSREDDREDSKRREGAVLPLGARSEFKSLALQSIAVDSILDVSWRSCRDDEQEGRVEWEDEQVLNSEDDDEAEEESKSPLRLSSASVWALCPGLRPALAEHLTSALDATQAAHITDSSRLKVPLSFAVDASHEALLHVTRYVRCGTLLLPSASFGADLTLLLEMMKLATKWEMQSLLEETSNIVSGVLTEGCLDECELYGRTYGVPALVCVCKLFRADLEAIATEEQEGERGALLLNKRNSGSAAYSVHLADDSIDGHTQQQTAYHQSRSQGEPDANFDSVYGNDSSFIEAEPLSDGHKLLGLYTKHLTAEGEGDGNGTYGSYSRQKLLRDLYKADCEESDKTDKYRELPYEKERDREKDREKEKRKIKSGGIYGLLLKSSVDSGQDSAESRYTPESLGPGRGHVSAAGSWKPSAGVGLGDSVHQGVDSGDRRVGSSDSSFTGAHDSVADSSSIGRVARGNYNGTVTATYRINGQHGQNNSYSSSSSSSSGAGAGASSMASKVLAVPVHLRPKSAFGRSSIGEDSTRKTPVKRPVPPSLESEGSATPSMYEEHVHRRHDSASASVSSSQTPRRYKSLGQPDDASREAGPRRAPSLPGPSPTTPSRKYSSSGRVTVALNGSSSNAGDLTHHDSSRANGARDGINANYSSGGRNDSSGSGRSHSRGGGGGGGVPKVAAVFRLLESSIEQEIAAAAVFESTRARRDVSPLGRGLNEDDDESVTSHGSNLRTGHGPGEGSVRESLILLKARKKSLTSMRSSRHSTTAQELEQNAADEESFTESNKHGARHSRRNNAFSDDAQSVVSEQSSSSSHRPSRPTMSSKTSVPFSGGRTDGTPASKHHLSRSSDPPDSSPNDSALGRNQHTQAMHPCPHCSRSFGAESLGRHVKICARIFTKKRQVFDSVQMRGIDENKWAIPRTGTGGQGKSSQSRAPPVGDRAGGNTQAEVQVPKWKVQSELFRESLKASRMTSQAIASGKPLPPSVRSVDPTLVPCPHCCRRFNQKAAERHIPVCSSIRAKPTMLFRGSGVGPGQATHSKTLPMPSRNQY